MKIAVLASGGVDSSVALKLLKDQGQDLTAFYIKIWLEDELSYLGSCPWEEDLEYVQKICTEIGVPLEVIPLQEQYYDRVVQYTLDEVKKGRTPNPDILCNSRIKFGAFLDVLPSEFEVVATGHYARTKTKGQITYLRTAADTFKDQTYFLANLKQDQIARLVFPIGELMKSEVRELASEFDLPNKDRKDSQGICFLGKIEFRDFLKHHLGVEKGDFIEFETNKKIGEHDGYWYYTIGQRKGIHLSGGPWYVVKKDIPSNTVFISNKFDADTGTTDTFFVPNVNWISGRCPTKENLKVKVRHGENMYGCSVEYLGKTRIKVVMDEKDYIAPGQFAVFYDEEYCLGGGVMSLTSSNETSSS
jgi:tRNA-specific 2-thiouridylase